MSDPPTLDDCLIILGYTTFFHLILTSSGGASKAYESSCHLIIPDSMTSSFNFLSSLSVHALLQFTTFSSNSSLDSNNSLRDLVLVYGTGLGMRPVLYLTCRISISYLILPCQRLMIELIERRLRMCPFTSYHLIPCFFTPSLSNWSYSEDHFAKLFVILLIILIRMEGKD